MKERLLSPLGFLFGPRGREGWRKGEPEKICPSPAHALRLINPPETSSYVPVEFIPVCIVKNDFIGL